jgi:hypothetical protein
VVCNARKPAGTRAINTPEPTTISVVRLRPPDPQSRKTSFDDDAGCGNVINPSNAATAGVLSLVGDVSCQGSCRGTTTNEACGAINTFISIYEYTVSGFLRNACVPMLLLFCVLYVMSAFGGGGERPIERSAEERTGGDQIRGLAVGEWDAGGVVEGPLCWDTSDANLQALPMNSAKAPNNQWRVVCRYPLARRTERSISSAAHEQQYVTEKFILISLWAHFYQCLGASKLCTFSFV